jgi:hypothetical protein
MYWGKPWYYVLVQWALWFFVNMMTSKLARMPALHFKNLNACQPSSYVALELALNEFLICMHSLALHKLASPCICAFTTL